MTEEHGLPQGSQLNMDSEPSDTEKAVRNSDPSKKKKGRIGRPRLHSETGTDLSTVEDQANGASGANGSNMVSVNEVIPKVWIISNFSVPIMAQIAVEALKKGDKVVLGCCPGGENEHHLLKQADRLRQRCPDRCIVVELDVK